MYVYLMPRAIAGTVQQQPVSVLHPGSLGMTFAEALVSSRGGYPRGRCVQCERAVVAGLQPRTGIPTKPRKEGWNATLGSSLFSACHWAWRVGWKLASG